MSTTIYNAMIFQNNILDGITIFFLNKKLLLMLQQLMNDLKNKKNIFQYAEIVFQKFSNSN